MAELNFSTLSGVWVSCNLFIDDEGIEHRIAPYKNLLEAYEEQFPVACYIQLYGEHAKDVVLK